MKKEHDTKALDGLFAEGYREIRPGGWIKAAGYWWQSDQLIPFVGRRALVMMQDYWQQECSAHPEGCDRKTTIYLNDPKSRKESQNEQF